MSDVILVTGASGLIGSRLIADLSRDYTIVGMDLVAPPVGWAGHDYVRADLTDEDSTRQALERVARQHGPRLRAIVHLAAYYDFSGKPSDLYRRLTIEGTRRMLRLARTIFEEVGQFVFTSTTLVLQPADVPGQVLDEQSPLEGKWDYPASKILAEEVIFREHGDIPTVVLRLAGVYDEWGHSPPLAHHLWRIRDKSLDSYLFPANPHAVQHYVHLDDAVLAIRRALESRARLSEHEVFLIAEPEGVSHADLQELFGLAVHGEAWPTLRVPKVVAKLGARLEHAVGMGDPFIQPWMVDLAGDSFPMSIDKATRMLDFHPRHRLRDVIPKMAATMRSDPKLFALVNALGEVEEEVEA